MYRFENYLFICVFYKISEYIEGFQIIFFLPHLKFVKNIAFFICIYFYLFFWKITSQFLLLFFLLQKYQSPAFLQFVRLRIY